MKHFRILIVFLLLLAATLAAASEKPTAEQIGQSLLFQLRTGQIVLSNTTNQPIPFTASALDADGQEIGKVFELPPDIAPKSSLFLPIKEGVSYPGAVVIEVDSKKTGLIGVFTDENGTSTHAQGIGQKASKAPVVKSSRAISTTQLSVNDVIVSYSRHDYFDYSYGYQPGECMQFAKIIVSEAGGNKSMVRSNRGDTSYNNIQRGMIAQSPLPHTFIALSDYDSSCGVQVLDSNWVGHYKIGVHWFSPAQLKKYSFKGYWADSRKISDNIRTISDTLKFANSFVVDR